MLQFLLPDPAYKMIPELQEASRFGWVRSSLEGSCHSLTSIVVKKHSHESTLWRKRFIPLIDLCSSVKEHKIETQGRNLEEGAGAQAKEKYCLFYKKKLVK